MRVDKLAAGAKHNRGGKLKYDDQITELLLSEWSRGVQTPMAVTEPPKGWGLM